MKKNVRLVLPLLLGLVFSLNTWQYVSAQSYNRLMPTDDCAVAKTKYGETAGEDVLNTTNLNDRQDMQLITKSEDVRVAYLKFYIGDLQGQQALGAYIQIRSALHGLATDLKPYELNLYPVDNTDWSERTITWANQPITDPTKPPSSVISTISIIKGVNTNNTTGSGTFYFRGAAFKNYINNAIAAGKKYVSFMISTPVSEADIWVGKRQNITNGYSSFLVLEGLTQSNIGPFLDGQVSSLDQNTNYNSLDYMEVKKDEKISFLRFYIGELAGTQATATINNIILRMKARLQTSGSNLEIGAYLCNDGDITKNQWAEKSLTESVSAMNNWTTPLTYTSAPYILTSKIASLTLDGANTNSLTDRYYQFSDLGLKDTIVRRIEKKYGFITIALKAETNANTAIFQRRHSLGGMAQLSIEYPVGKCYNCGDYAKIRPVDTLFSYPTNSNLAITQATFNYYNGKIKLTSATEEVDIYYTLDGTMPNPTTSTKYSFTTGIDITTDVSVTTFKYLKAIAVKKDWFDSDILNVTVTTNPLGPLTFLYFYKSDLNAAIPCCIDYTKDVVVKISGVGVTVPKDQITIAKNGTDEVSALYDDVNGIIYEIAGNSFVSRVETLRARARALAAGPGDLYYYTPIYTQSVSMVKPTTGFGVGPAGVGQKDNKTTGQPECVVWLKTDDAGLFVDASGFVHSWGDLSGNNNNATDKYRGQKPPFWDWAKDGLSQNSPTLDPVLLNGKQMVKFGDNAGFSSLVIDDKDNLDGGPGLSIFMVARRNWQSISHTQPLDKRETSPASAQAWAFQMNGGASPNVPGIQINSTQFELYANNGAYQTWGNADGSADKAHLVNVDFNSLTQKSGVFTDGFLQNSKGGYKSTINTNRAPIVMCPNEKISIAEIIIYRTGLNAAERRIIQNYLDLKYGFNNIDSKTNDTLQIYRDAIYSQDLIGVGKIKTEMGEPYTATTVPEHNNSSGGGLVLSAYAPFYENDFIFAGHQVDTLGMVDINDTWARIWHIEGKNAVTKIKPASKLELKFRFSAYGLQPPTKFNYKLWYSTTGKVGEAGNWVDYLLTEGEDTEVKPENNDETLKFTPFIFKNGYYAFGPAAPVWQRKINSSNEVWNNNQLSIYPNPTNGSFTLTMNNAVKGKFNVVIRDLAGKALQTYDCEKAEGSFNKVFNLNNLKAGIYFVELQQGSSRTVKRLAVQ